MWEEEQEFEDSGMTHSQQCYSDLQDSVNEKLRRGEIDEEQAAEMRMGA
jgi:hypothetical protein